MAPEGHIQTNVGTTALSSRARSSSRAGMLWDAAKGNDTSTCDWCKLPPRSPALGSAQPGVGKTSCCCFLAAERAGRGCSVPGRGLRAACSPALPSPAAIPGWELSTAKCSSPVPYLGFCPNCGNVASVSRMNNVGAGRERLRGSHGERGECRAGRASSSAGIDSGR